MKRRKKVDNTEHRVEVGNYINNSFDKGSQIVRRNVWLEN